MSWAWAGGTELALDFVLNVVIITLKLTMRLEYNVAVYLTCLFTIRRHIQTLHSKVNYFI